MINIKGLVNRTIEYISNINWREVTLNSIIMLATVMIVLSSFEAALVMGMIGSEETETQFCQGNSTNQFHPVYGKIKQPNSQYVQEWRGTSDKTLHTHNSKGFRDTYNSGNKNVVVLGDSYVEGYLADDNETIPYLLDRGSPQVAFRNYGIGGFGTDQELLVYRNVSKSVNHDAVVLVFYLNNDMRNNVANSYRRPQFAIKNESLVQIHQPQDMVGRTEYDEDFVQSIQNFLRDYTETYPYVAKNIKRITSTRPDPPAGDDLEQQLKLTRALIDEVATEARTNNATLYVVSMPSRGEISSSAASVYPENKAQPYWNIQREMLANVSTSHRHVSYLSLRDSLSSAEENGTQVYGSVNPHLTEHGYRIAATDIFQRLAADDVLSDNATIKRTSTRGDIQECQT